MAKIECVLFDLDGTLLDTSYDFCYALDLVCQEFDTTAPSYPELRPIVSQGGSAMVRLAFPTATDAEHATRLARFLEIYHANIARHTCLFPGLEPGLVALAAKQIPWGIVTNKPTWLTEKLLQEIQFPAAPKALVCGDTLEQRKPEPEPMLLAAEQAGVPAKNCIYFGDHLRDIEAGINAKMQTGAALFGYLSPEKAQELQIADHQFATPYAISEFLQKL